MCSKNTISRFYRTTIKEILKSTKEKEAQKAELTAKIKELEKQAGKLRMKGTLYSLFGNSELDKAEKRIADLEQEAERQQYLSEKEKNEIRKEVVLLQDTVKGRDRAIAELKETVQVYEEERNWIKRFFNGFYQLLNIRLMLRKMGFSDDRIAEMYRTETPQRGTAKAYSGLYKREFTEEDSESSRMRRNDRSSLSMGFPLPIGANRNGNNLSIATTHNGCKTENPLSLSSL